MSISLVTRFRNTCILGALSLLGLPAIALATSYTSTQFSSLPVTAAQSTTNAEPLVMLLLSKDDSLYKKAYTDVTDLTGNGSPNTTYTDSFTYYGYYNSSDCYTYDATNNYFTPSVGAGGTNGHTCSAGTAWSGNFLNWASMTRLDVLRKVLYGGYRSTDTAGKTILERAYIPTDAHSFAKVYTPTGTDPAIDELTPFTTTTGSITICNTTDATSSTNAKYSQNVTAPPLLRVADGKFSKWAANERWQCLWDGQTIGSKTYSPVKDAAGDNVVAKTLALGQGDYVARNEVCDGTLLNASNCTEYTDSNGESDYKPTGLLQTYGETGKIKFGLMTGSYVKSRSGGVLRKNISDFSNEVNASDGTFTNVAGIVSTINDLRVHGYDTQTGVYNDSYGTGTAGDSCSWGWSDAATQFPEPACSNWGNPMSEMYLEAVRYFDDQSPDPDFNSSSYSDSTWIPGVNGSPALSTATWSTNPKPLNANNWCAKCAIIVLNAGPFSYGSATLIDNGFSNLAGSSNVTAESLTDQIGNWEGISGAGTKYFIGDNGTTTTSTGLCTPKTIPYLSKALGPCPDLPRLGGSYDIAGIAYWAHTNNLNASAPSNSPQTVTTYAVSLSSTTPVIKIPVPGSTTNQIVKLLPACQDTWGDFNTTSTQTPGDCRITDVQITQPYTLSGGTATGQIYVNYDDSEQGGDFDQDMWGTINYSITGTTITITTQVDYQSTGFKMGFGYVITGTATEDGTHMTSGINNYSFPPGDTISNYCSSTTPCECATSNVGSSPTACSTSPTASNTYTLSTSSSSTTSILEDPLWYAAKYGGFIDINSTHTITSAAQWDSVINSTGTSGSDGIPDNYFTSNNPGQLKNNLGRVLQNITEQVSSGTAAAVVANAGSGAGMIVQALYQPVRTNNSTNPPQRVTWVGRLYSLFVDDHNNLREDGNQNGILDDYATDPVVSLQYVKSSNQTEVAVYTTTDGINLTLDHLEPLYDLKPIWSAREQLANIKNSDIPTQRAYSTKIDASNGRYIFTAINSDGDNIINNADVVPFDDTSIGPTNYGWFDLQTDLNGDGKIDSKDADDLVNYIRGEDGLDNFRSRTIDYDNSGVDKVWRLGDIIHSTPLIVGAPDSGWDNTYGDPTYTTFKNDYANRRVVVYAGANDGMLHAFNAGFYDSKFKAYCTQPPDVTNETQACTPISGTTDVADPLGSELWAYVPSNLLPQLQWLTEPNYPHVYYVDGKPQTYDVNIFTPGVDTTTGIDHPDGWGTILVVGMRLGGGDMTYSPGNNNTNITARSAYIIMDITDPEKPPVLLGEISDSKLGFTTSTPTLIFRREPGTGNDWTNPAVNDWYLAFGSGPDATQNGLATVTSTQDAQLYVLNLKSLAQGTTPSVQYVNKFGPYDLGITNSFVGDLNSVDWTRNYNTDAVYFGTVGGDATTPTGRLMRLVIPSDDNSNSTWETSSVINPSQPFVNKPQFAIDDQGKWWVYDGTGRLYVAGDSASITQQSFYGIKEQVSSTTGLPSDTTITQSDLQNTTGVQVGIDGTLYDTAGVLPSSIKTFSDLETEIEGMSGWYINFFAPTTTGGLGSERNLGSSLLYQQLMLFTTFIPNNNSCTFAGSSNLYGLYYKTGTAYAYNGQTAGLGEATCKNCAVSGVTISQSSIALDGSTTSGVVLLGIDASNTQAYITGTHGQGFGATPYGVPTPTGRQSWREIIPQ